MPSNHLNLCHPLLLSQHQGLFQWHGRMGNWTTQPGWICVKKAAIPAVVPPLLSSLEEWLLEWKQDRSTLHQHWGAVLSSPQSLFWSHFSHIQTWPILPQGKSQRVRIKVTLLIQVLIILKLAPLKGNGEGTGAKRLHMRSQSATRLWPTVGGDSKKPWNQKQRIGISTWGGGPSLTYSSSRCLCNSLIWVSPQWLSPLIEGLLPLLPHRIHRALVPWFSLGLGLEKNGSALFAFTKALQQLVLQGGSVTQLWLCGPSNQSRLWKPSCHPMSGKWFPRRAWGAKSPQGADCLWRASSIASILVSPRPGWSAPYRPLGVHCHSAYNPSLISLEWLLNIIPHYNIPLLRISQSTCHYTWNQIQTFTKIYEPLCGQPWTYFSNLIFYHWLSHQTCHGILVSRHFHCLFSSWKALPSYLLLVTTFL